MTQYSVPEQPAQPEKDPAVYGTLSPYLFGFIENLPDSAGVPIAVWLKSPSDEELEATLAKKPGVEEFLETPHVGDGVLNGRAGKRDAAGNAKRANRPRHLGVGVLDGLRLVENDARPFDLGELVVVADEERVARNHDVCFGRRLLEAAPYMAHVPLVDIDSQRRREPRKLVPPVRKQRQRRNNKSSPHLTPDPN